MGCCRYVMGLAALAMAVAGCSPRSAVSWGVKLVGEAVNHADVEERKAKLLGKSPAAADDMFGERLDAFLDVGSSRRWLVYPVELDIRDRHRYVVAVANDRVVALSKTKKDARPKLDIPAKLIFTEKVKGKSSADCQANLGLGPPLLTARSEATGRLSQLYKAQLIEIDGITKPHYCVLRFDALDLCTKVELVSVVAD